MTPRPTLRRLAAIILLGPLVGAISLGALSLLFPSTGDTNPNPVTRVLTLISVGYGLGLIPAALAAAGYWLAYPRIHRLPFFQTLLATLAIGGLCGAVSVGISLFVSGHAMTMPFALIGAGAAAGALALAATALPLRRQAP